MTAVSKARIESLEDAIALLARYGGTRTHTYRAAGVALAVVANGGLRTEHALLWLNKFIEEAGLEVEIISLHPQRNPGRSQTKEPK